MAPEWQAAMEALILVATLGGPTMFAPIGVLRPMNRHVANFKPKYQFVETSPRRDRESLPT
jgi:hypothetical protein